MNTISLSGSKLPIQLTALLAIGFMLGLATAQDKPDAATADKPLNLNVQDIAKELIKEDKQDGKSDSTETVSVQPNKMDETFIKAEKPGLIPKVTEINVTGAPQRVTKVTSAAGTYCVYTPSVGRTDGIDEIQNGAQNQVRTCPQQ